MGIEKLFRTEVSRGEQTQLSEELLDDHFNAIKRAYDQAGLDPNAFPKPESPGVVTDAGQFQVRLMQTPEGEILGASSLAMDSEEKHINETDIFMWDGQFDRSSGRLITPDRHSLMDYRLNADGLQAITEFIEDSLAAGDFVAVEAQSKTSLPQ